jgi:hypothetical protein
VQHHPAGELLVRRLLGITRQPDGVGGLDEVGRRVVLPEQPRHPDREEVRLARVGEVDRANLAPVLLEQDAGVLERAARLALAQESAVQIAVISLRDLGVGDQVVEKVGAADRMDMVIRLAASFVAKATPVAQVRRALLEARAAEDEATAIRSQVRPATIDPAQPAIDTAAIYAARNQNVR